jgi:hypothetical protein
VAAILFLLPFFSVSCTGSLARELRAVGAQRSDLRFELSGWDLVLGSIPKQVEGFQRFEGPGTAHPLAIGLGVAVAAGIVLSGLPRRLGGGAGAVLGAAGIVLLSSWARSGEEARARVQENARKDIHVSWEVGAWAVVGVLAVATLHGLVRMIRVPDRPP